MCTIGVHPHGYIGAPAAGPAFPVKYGCCDVDEASLWLQQGVPTRSAGLRASQRGLAEHRKRLGDGENSTGVG